ncbi:MarR family winged helix-turn-helix transcriptional regulator [Caminibacter sp.]
MKLNKDNSLGYALTTTLNTLRKNFNQAIKEFEITSEQFAVLKLLDEFEELTPSEIAKLLARDKANITRIINSLMKKELIKKENVNKKSYKIKLNKKGKSILQKADKVAMKFSEKIKNLIGEDDYNLIIEKLKLIRENF